MNDRGGNGARCFDVEEWADTIELTNVKVARLGKCSYLVGERKVFIKDEAENTSRVSGAERAVIVSWLVLLLFVLDHFNNYFAVTFRNELQEKPQLNLPHR